MLQKKVSFCVSFIFGFESLSFVMSTIMHSKNLIKTVVSIVLHWCFPKILTETNTKILLGQLE